MNFLRERSAPPQLSDLSSIEHFCNVLEREIRILDEQETNLEELRGAIKNSWFQIKKKMVSEHRKKIWVCSKGQKGLVNALAVVNEIFISAAPLSLCMILKYIQK